MISNLEKVFEWANFVVYIYTYIRLKKYPYRGKENYIFS